MIAVVIFSLFFLSLFNSENFMKANVDFIYQSIRKNLK